MSKIVVKYIIVCIMVSNYLNTYAQNKSGYAFVYGLGGIYAQFDGSGNLPIVDSAYFPHTNAQRFFTGSSSICDSATGNLKVVTNGYLLFSSNGNVMQNGDSLVPKNIYLFNGPNTLLSYMPQTSLILPKGSSGLYYVFTTTITDTTYNKYLGSVEKFPYDLLQYHVVDMNQNGGLGKVFQKNVPVITNYEINRVGMQACRHANGYDWWLIKQAGLDSTAIFKILVTADSVVIKDTQRIPNLAYGKWDGEGQSCFSTNGKKYAFSCGRTSQLLLADFDRCSAELRSIQILNIPKDSTTDPYSINAGKWDSVINGVCFAPNDSFIYITRDYNIYQYELNNPDSATAWVRIKHGEDTSLLWFERYGILHKGIDGRIYIGKNSNSSSSNSLINKPNLKGLACDFCRKCLRYDLPDMHTCAPSNMPDFTLGADSSGCWPLSSEQLIVNNEQWELYPNPVNAILYIKHAKGKEKKLYNTYGQLLISTTKEEIDISGLAKGLYFLSCEQQTQKVLVEY